MRRAILLLLVILSYPIVTSAQGYRGKEFWLAFPQNARIELNRVQHISLYIAADHRTSGTVEFGNGLRPITISVEAGASSWFNLDTILEMTKPGVIDSLSAHVVVDNDVSLYVIQHRNASTDSYMAIPADRLGTKYLIAGYSSLGYAGASTEFTTEAGIVATENNTSVSVRLSDSVRGYLDSTVFYPRGRTLTYILQRGQTLLLNSEDNRAKSDLTGSVVTASRPIAFVTGHRCAQIPVNKSYCDALLEMEPPTTKLGTDFLVPAFAAKQTYVARVIAADDSTELKVDGAHVKTLQQGEFWESPIETKDIAITTSRPALVSQYCTSWEADSTRVADPFMLLVTPRERFVKEATAVTLTVGEWEHFLTIVTRKEDLPDLRVDGNQPGPDAIDGHTEYTNGTYTITGTSWQPALSKHTERSRERAIQGVAYSPYVVVRCQVSPGRHTIFSAKPFAAYEYGFGAGPDNFDSYGNTCGQDLSAP